MDATLQYYLGALATRDDISNQAKELRSILSTSEERQLIRIKEFISQQKEINSDTVSILNIAVVPGYGSEYFGLGGENWLIKADFFKSLVDKFPQVFSFKFNFANCACMAGIPVLNFYSILEEGIIQDKTKKYYPSGEIFEAIRDSKFNFQFELLVLDHYRQPCSKNDFEDYVNELKEEFNSFEQIQQLDNLQWKRQ